MSVPAHMRSIADSPEFAVYQRSVTTRRSHSHLVLVPDYAPEPLPPRSPMAPLRLTRRGVVAMRLGVGLVALLMLLVAHLSLTTAAASGGEVPHAGVMTVHSGDTLWSIAEEVAPGRDPRAVVQRLRDINHLSGVSLRQGQLLAVN